MEQLLTLRPLHYWESKLGTCRNWEIGYILSSNYIKFTNKMAIFTQNVPKGLQKEYKATDKMIKLNENGILNHNFQKKYVINEVEPPIYRLFY